MSLRAAFPVLARIAYLNAGTDGPVPARAAAAADAALRAQLDPGRAGKRHLEQLREACAAIRGRAAAGLGCATEHPALTHAPTDGMNLVLHGLPLEPGDQAVTRHEGH